MKLIWQGKHIGRNTMLLHYGKHVYFLYIVLEVLQAASLRMQRPRRQAAQDALLKIRSIREWENLPETSQRFIEYAALIDTELEAEISKKKVSTSDLDLCETEEEESNDEYCDADDGFVVGDQHMVEADPDFCPCEDNQECEPQEEFDDDDADDASEEVSEEASEEEMEETSEEELEDACEHESEDASQHNSEQVSRDATEDALEDTSLPAP
jgi:hypothetical protein